MNDFHLWCYMTHNFRLNSTVW